MSKSSFLILGLLFSFSFTMNAQLGTVIFHVSDIQLDKGGEISAGIFTKSNFPEVGKQYKSIEEDANSAYLEVTLKDVLPGVYGAVVFQDTDKNKDLETNFVGYPKEPIGFANDAVIRFGPPAFEDASIVVEEGKVTIVKIKLR